MFFRMLNDYVFGAAELKGGRLSGLDARFETLDQLAHEVVVVAEDLSVPCHATLPAFFFLLELLHVFIFT